MIANASEDEWDGLIRVHLKGHFGRLRTRGLLAHRVERGRQPSAASSTRLGRRPVRQRRQVQLLNSQSRHSRR